MELCTVEIIIKFMTILCDITNLHISTMLKLRLKKIHTLLDHGLITVKFSHQ